LFRNRKKELKSHTSSQGVTKIQRTSKLIKEENKMKRTVITLSLILALAIALSVSIPALAATGSTTVSGTIGKFIDVSATTPANLGAMTPGVAATSAITVTVKCTTPNWTLKAEDLSEAGHTGHMDNTSVSTVFLKNALNVSGGDQILLAPLSSAVQLETGTNSVRGKTDISTTFNQMADFEDAEGSYDIVVTFTGTTN
jgi:hypothetical protein